MMKKLLVYVFIIISLTFLGSCSVVEKNNLSLPKKLNPYLSITLAKEVENTQTESGIIIVNYCYDLDTGKIEEIETSVDYTSQFPLSVYDKIGN